jgi:hypothetical protein
VGGLDTYGVDLEQSLRGRFELVDVAEAEVREDLTACHARDPICLYCACQERNTGCNAAYAVAYDVKFPILFLLAHEFHGGFDVQARVVCGVSLLGDGKDTEAQSGDVASVSECGEVVNSVGLNGWQCEDLVIH